MTRWLASLLLLAASSLLAQQSPATPNAAPASVRFSFDWAQGFPWQKYSIDVQANGKSHFDGNPHPDQNSEAEAVQKDFIMSPANQQKIFELAQKLNYFRGDLDSHLKHVAQTGKKTLQYQSLQVQGSATYNYSQNPDVEELTRLFTAIAMTVDYGEKLAFQYRFDKLGMDQRMKELQDLEASHGVEELAIITPILRKIYHDPNIMNMDREIARHLLLDIDKPPAAPTITQ